MSLTVTEEVARLIRAEGRGAKARLASHLGIRPGAVGKWAALEANCELEHWPGIEEYFGLDRGHLSRFDLGDSRLVDRLDRLERMLSRAHLELDELRRAAGLPPEDFERAD